MSAKLSLKIKPRLEELKRISAAIEDFGGEENWSPALVFRVNLVLEELGLNIMSYGHDDHLHEIEITLTSEADVFTIEVADDGRPFDPLNDAPRPNLEAALEDRAVGGLGLHLVRTLMDEMHYRRERGKNHLTLIKGRVE